MLGPEFRIYIVHPYLDASAAPVSYPCSNSRQDRLPIVPPGQAAAIYALLVQFRNPSYIGRYRDTSIHIGRASTGVQCPM